jgi:tetratricopeptide (TPR) repeat protein
MRRIPTAVVVLLLLPAACDDNARQSSMKQAVSDYQARNYSLAQKRSVESMRNADGVAREQAAYLAGLSEYQMGDLNAAADHLMIAAASSDAELAARSRAMLGLVRMKQNRPREAATLLSAAANSLKGEDARQAALNAAEAYRLSGDAGAARQWSARAAAMPASPVTVSQSTSTNVSAPKVANAGGAVPERGVFALQVGAFHDPEHAKRAADTAAVLAEPRGMGPVRVIPTTDDRGKRMFLVQFGRFDSRAAAANARQRLGKLEYIVAPKARDS